jgi:TonB family protein
MFHYRQALTSKQIRILIAGFLAISMHIGLLYFKIDHKPFLSPHVSLPRSVSVFLGQRSPEISSVKQQQETQKITLIEEKETRHEVQKKELIYEKKPTEIKEAENVSQPHNGLKTNTITVDEVLEEKSLLKNNELISPTQTIEHVKPGTVKVTEVEETGEVTNSPAVMEVEGVLKAGTIQLAYPRYQLNVPPVYPGLARKRGQEGKVILQVLVNREGRVDDLEIDDSSGHSLLDRAAETAVRKWLFEPGKKGEEKVQMWVRVPVFFKLKK